MRYYTLVFVSFYFFGALTAQDWLPFPPGQKSMYQYSDGSFDSYEVDSIDGDRYFFHGQYASFGCLSDSIYNPYWNTQDYVLRPALYDIAGDTIFSGAFSFKRDLDPGEQYVLDVSGTGPVSAWQFEYTGQDLRTFAGVSDSVKAYHIQSVGSAVFSDTFLLSKQHGLVRYTVWKRLLEGAAAPPIASLVSLDVGAGSSTSIPVTDANSFSPEFQVGDKLCWSYETYGINLPTERYDFCDRLIADKGFGTFDINRLTSEGLDTILENRNPMPIWAYPSNLLALPSSHWGVMDMIGGFSFLQRYNYMDLPVPGYELSFVFNGESHYGGCEIFMLPDWGLNMTADTYAGLKYYESEGITGDGMGGVTFRTTIYERLGYVKDGIEYGSIPLGQNQFESKDLSVYPNPTGAFLIIDVPSELVQSTVRVFDLTGMLIMELPVSSRLDVSGLSGGLYHLEIALAQTVWRARFVKL